VDCIQLADSFEHSNVGCMAVIGVLIHE